MQPARGEASGSVKQIKNKTSPPNLHKWLAKRGDEYGDVLARTVTDKATARARFAPALSSFRCIGDRLDEAVALANLAGVTTGAERDGHLLAAREIWLALDLPDQVARLDAG